MSQWIGPFFIGLWLKEYLVPNMTRMELSSSKYDAKNWTFEYDSNFFKKKKRLTEFNLYSSKMTKELAFFLNMTQRIEPFIFLNMTHRIKPFIFKSVSNWTFFFKELNSLFLIILEVLNFFFWVRLKELNPVFCDSKIFF